MKKAFDAADFQNRLTTLIFEISHGQADHVWSIAKGIRADMKDRQCSAAEGLAIYLSMCLDHARMPEPDVLREYEQRVIVEIATKTTVGNVVKHKHRSSAMHKGKRVKIQDRDKNIVKFYNLNYFESFGGGRNAVAAAAAIHADWDELTEYTDLKATKAPSKRIIADAIRKSSRYQNK